MSPSSTCPPRDSPWLGLHVSNNPALAIPKNWEAVKYAIDYAGLASIYKTGGRPAAGCIPQGMANALSIDDSSVLKQDTARAKAALEAAGNPTGFTFKMTYASDQLYQNVPATDVAQKVAADLQAVGIQANLNPEPASQESTDFRAGKLEASIHVWGADYLGWTDFLPNFAPGGNVAAKRQGWQTTQSAEAKQIADWSTQASQTVDLATQNDLCVKAQQLMNKVGPACLAIRDDEPDRLPLGRHQVTRDEPRHVRRRHRRRTALGLFARRGGWATRCLSTSPAIHELS